MRGVREVAAAAAVVACGVLAGCSGGDHELVREATDWSTPGASYAPDEPASPPPSAVASAPPSASPGDVAVRTAIGANTPESAEAFAAQLVHELDHAYATGDVGTLRTMFEPGCKVCKRYLNSVQLRYGAGGRYITTGWQLQKAQALGIDGRSGRYVRLTLATDGLIGEDKRGTRERIEGPGSGHLVFLFRLDGKAWRLEEQTGNWVASQ